MGGTHHNRHDQSGRLVRRMVTAKTKGQLLERMRTVPQRGGRRPDAGTPRSHRRSVSRRVGTRRPARFGRPRHRGPVPRRHHPLPRAEDRPQAAAHSVGPRRLRHARRYVSARRQTRPRRQTRRTIFADVAATRPFRVASSTALRRSRRARLAQRRSDRARRQARAQPGSHDDIRAGLCLPRLGPGPSTGGCFRHDVDVRAAPRRVARPRLGLCRH